MPCYNCIHKKDVDETLCPINQFCGMSCEYITDYNYECDLYIENDRDARRDRRKAIMRLLKEEIKDFLGRYKWL